MRVWIFYDLGVMFTFQRSLKCGHSGIISTVPVELQLP